MRKIFLFISVLLITFVGCRRKDSNIVNTAPIADAGRIQNVLTGSEVILDGSASNDADNDSLRFKWELKEVPENSNAKLSDDTYSHPTFIADKDGEYIAELVVNDGDIDSKPSTIVITSTYAGSNSIPVAHAGNDRNIHIGNTVTLDGTASTDANGHNLDYSWRVKTAPVKSSAKISNETIGTPIFTPDLNGVYVIELVVHDGQINSKPDELQISVSTPTNKKSQLMALGLDATDAQYLLDNHPNDVDDVLSNKDRIFKDMPALNNGMFALPTDPDAGPFNSYNLQNWSTQYKKGFRKMFGRLVFTINSPLFKKSFNDNIKLLNPAYQGNGNADIPFPHNYTEFKNAANKALADYHYKYKFFVSGANTGIAHGMVGLKLEVERNMFGPQRPGAPHNPASLVLHELTHTWGYNHVGPNSGDYTLKPNNIPYYVQFIVGVSYKNPDKTMVWGTPDALLTVYFGNK